MSPELLRELLEEVAGGSLGLDDALARLAALPYEGMGHTLVDHHREVRQGFPETIYGAGKTQCAAHRNLGRIALASGRALATRVDAPEAARCWPRCPTPTTTRSRASCIWAISPAPRPDAPLALVICAGTSDLPVAGEAAQTLAFLGDRVEQVTDVGVAGLHRLLSRLDALRAADVIIAVAGMEGALASVVGGLADCPVIGVPTNVGYGVADGGRTACMRCSAPAPPELAWSTSTTATAPPCWPIRFCAAR
ncbi:MAG: nickel pincer cofactor biosynthesis protein LarB [Kiritimatiellia bacterium]